MGKVAEDKSKKNEIVILDNRQITRSNSMITAKYTSSLIENKLMVWALQAAQPDEHGRPSVSMTTDEVRQLTGVKGNGIYDALKRAAGQMIGRTMFIEDKEKHSFAYLNLIHYAQFKDGIFTVTFTPECNDMLYNLKNNFTSMKLKTLFSFKSNYAFRLYEILKTKEYNIPDSNYPYSITYDLADLKLQLNCINTEEKKVKIELQKKDPDLDKIVNEIAEDKKFEKWYEFKRKVLNKAVREINETTDLFVHYDPVKSGRGGKVVKVTFLMQHNVGQKEMLYEDKAFTNTREESAMNEAAMQRSRMIDDVKEIISGEDITDKEAVVLLKASGNDLNEIKRLYDLAKKQDYIKNFMGWMVKGLQEGYQEPIRTSEGSDEVVEVVKDIHQNIAENEEEFAKNAWERIKSNDHFPQFVEYVQTTTGLEMVLFETFYTASERVKLYGKWFKTITQNV